MRQEGLPCSNGEHETTTVPQLPIMIFQLPHKHGLWTINSKAVLENHIKRDSTHRIKGLSSLFENSSSLITLFFTLKKYANLSIRVFYFSAKADDLLTFLLFCRNP